MTRKKENDSFLSVEENAQVQQILAQFQLLAADLYQSASQEQAETALSTITNLSEAAQMALLKELSRQHSADSAAILLAINELSHDKNIRKEARRSLIRLEEAKIYPDWQPPVTQYPYHPAPCCQRAALLERVRHPISRRGRGTACPLLGTRTGLQRSSLDDLPARLLGGRHQRIYH